MRHLTDLLILGGSGPIGRGIARSAAGSSVVSSSRTGSVAVDVRDASAVERIVADCRPRTIIYLVNDSSANADIAATALAGVLDAAARGGAERFLLASSGAVYGDEGTSPYGEGATRAGMSDYAQTKIRSEDVVESFAATGVLSVLSLRIFNVFGNGCDGSLVNKLAVGPRPRLLATKNFVRDYVDAEEVAGAFLAAADRPDVQGAVNVARGIAVDNLQLAAAAGDEAFDSVDGADLWTYSVADVSRARTDLGWLAHIDPLAVLKQRLFASD